MDYVTLATKESEDMHLVEIKVNYKPAPVAKRERRSMWYYVAWPLLQVVYLLLDVATFVVQRR